MKRKLLPIAFAVISAAAGCYFMISGVQQQQKIDSERTENEAEKKKYHAPECIKWLSRSDAESRAKLDSKPLLYFFTATWCAPCRRIEKESLSDALIATAINENYYPVLILNPDLNDKSEAELCKKYKVSGFPTFVIADNSGKMLGYRPGYWNHDQLLEFFANNSGRSSSKK